MASFIFGDEPGDSAIRGVQDTSTESSALPPLDHEKVPSPSMTSTGKERRHFTLEMRLAGVVEFRVRTSSHSSSSSMFPSFFAPNVMDGELHHAMHPGSLPAGLGAEA